MDHTSTRPTALMLPQHNTQADAVLAPAGSGLLLARAWVRLRLCSPAFCGLLLRSSTGIWCGPEASPLPCLGQLDQCWISSGMLSATLWPDVMCIRLCCLLILCVKEVCQRENRCSCLLAGASVELLFRPGSLPSANAAAMYTTSNAHKTGMLHQ